MHANAPHFVKNKCESKNGPGVGSTEAANLSWGEVYSPEGGLVPGSKQQSMCADPDFQYPKH